MKLAKIREDFEETSGVVSELVRNLAFAAIGVIWILRIGATPTGDPTNAAASVGSITYSPVLLAPLFLLVAALAADVGQYVVKTVTLFGVNFFLWRKHKTEEADVKYSGWFNVLPNVLFIAKVVLVAAAYYKLLLFLYPAIVGQPENVR